MVVMLIMGFKMRYLDLKRKICSVRMLAIQGIAEAGSGHPGASFSAAELMGVLYFRKMNHSPEKPDWDERDYFINSKGHSAPGFYATLAYDGYFPPSEMKTLRKLGSRLQSHPVRYTPYEIHQSVPGIEFSGGSEGIGLSVSIGIALANRLDGKKNRVYTLIGDGESNEGQIWEAAMAAAKFKLHNLVAILDRNRIQQDGFTEDIMPLDPTRDKWSAFNWNVIEISGHNVEQIIDAINKASEAKDSPTIIIANTVKGNGIKHMTNNPQWHGKAPPREHTPLLLEELRSEFAQITDRLLSNGISPGIALNPSTDLPNWLFPHLQDVDVVLIMSVNPGFAGQKFIPEVLSKIRIINQKLREHGFLGYIEADGGIDATILQAVYEAGARIFVAGNAVY